MINMCILNNLWTGIDYDGVDERSYKDNPTGFTSDNTGSISFWVNFDDVTLANGGFLNVGGIGDTNAAQNQMNFGLRRDDALFPTDKKRVALINIISGVPHEVVGSTDISAGTLYNIVFVSNGSAWTIYLNGTAQTLTVRTGSNSGRWFQDFTWPGTPRFALGNVFRQNAWAPVSLNGKLYLALITSQQLTASQVSALYNSGIPKDPANVLDITQVRSIWSMGGSESGVITTLNDLRGSNNLTSENMENADIISSNFY